MESTELSAPSARSSAFRFEPRRARLDWRLLAAVDADRIARETDIDTLERALDTVSFGDIAVEDPRHLSGARLACAASQHDSLGALRLPPGRKRDAARRCGRHSAQSADRRPGFRGAGPSMVKLFRLAQMMIEYLLHVQARPARRGAGCLNGAKRCADPRGALRCECGALRRC